MALKNGTQAPDFSLSSTSGSTFQLAQDLAGKPCILYFYPKDFTSVCTKEACDFRDQFAVFRDAEITVLGISKDDIETHLRFKAQYKLPFELLSDASGKVCKAYDALVPIIGIPKRITYLLSAEHKIVASFQDMFSAEQHIRQMISKIAKGEHLGD